MEKGTLSVRVVKKGFHAEIVTGDGKKLIISEIKFSDVKHDGKPCLFTRAGGKLTLLKLLDGTVLHEVPVVHKAAPPAAGVVPTGNPLAHLKDAFLLAETRWPKDVRALPITDIDNYWLKLKNGARYTVMKEQKFLFFRNDGMPGKDGRPGVGDNYLTKPNYGAVDFRTLQARQQESAELLLSHHQKASFTPDWRMIVGLGHESVYEVSISLHHVYGFPYIPASTIKGICRSFVINECFESDEDKAKRDPFFCYIFGVDEKGYGKEATQGHVCFLDAFPSGPPSIEVEVMNVHYPDYYGRQASPTDTQNPNPINFLTVGQRDLQGNPLLFEFHLGMHRGTQRSDQSYPDSPLESFPGTNVVEKVKSMLTQALEFQGIGAKTAVGYGYMTAK